MPGAIKFAKCAPCSWKMERTLRKVTMQTQWIVDGIVRDLRLAGAWARA